MQGLVPIGDDTAVIAGSGGSKWLFTTDVIVDGVDFIHSKIAPQMAGRKAVAVNLSDIAAMGGTPVAFVAALGIPKGFSEAWIEKFYKGMTAIAKKYGTLFTGGDISRSKDFFCSVAMLGIAPEKGAVLRSGARAGDWIGVTGKFGGSIREHHYVFEPRVAEGKYLAQYFRPHAMIDVSDGLAQDLGHILKASGVGAAIEIQKIPKNGVSLEQALTDGEDFELLFTMGETQKEKLERGWRKKFPRTPLSWIGRIQKEKGIRWLDHTKPVRLPFEIKGFRHF